MSLTNSAYYITGGTMHTNAPSYVTRLADEELYKNLKEGHFCYVLTSRQMGKSSLMIRTRKKLQKDGYATVVLDLTSLGQNLSVEQWYDGLLVQIGEQLNLENELDDFWVKNSRLSCLQRWLNAIREIILPKQHSNLVIFIDEIDCVISLPFSTDEFFAGIRQLYNERSENLELLKLDFCLLGVVTPSDLISDPRTTPFNIGKRIELDDFTLKDTLPLIRGLNCNEILGEKIMQRVLYWTGGHPYLTQKLCRSIADYHTKSEDSVDFLCEEIFLSAQSRDKDDNLIFVRDRILKSDVSRADLLHLYMKIYSGDRIKPDRTNPLLNVLHLSGIISLNDNFVFIRNQIYAEIFDKDWVMENMPDAEIRRQKEAYRAGVKRTLSLSVLISLLVIFVITLAIQMVTSFNESIQLKMEKDAMQERIDKLDSENRVLKEQIERSEAEHLKKTIQLELELEKQSRKKSVNAVFKNVK
jgi:cell division protein FtsB